MPGLAFLHPALLWGLTLAAVPVLLHLLQRRRYRVRRWAAMEFLRTSVRRSSRRLRIEQWLLLLVRALILALAALALARPVWSTHSFGAGTRPRWSWLGSRAASQVVVVLDDSYGMGASDSGFWISDFGLGSRPRGNPKSKIQNPKSQFEVARARALELVQTGLTPGDSVSLVLASDPARALVRRPTFNLKEITTQIRQASLSDRPGDLAGAARLCLEILQSSRAAVREVYLLTNAQSVNWKQPDAAEAWRRVASISRLHLIPTQPARGANLAVDEVRVGGPVDPGRSASVVARISNWSAQPARGVVVALRADGAAVASTQLDVPAEGGAEARFEHTFATAGAHTVAVSLPGDSLAADNQGFASIVARDRVRVLILNGHPDPDPRQDAAFFLTAALAPDAQGTRNEERGTTDDPADPHSSSLIPHSSSPFVVRALSGESFRGTDLSRWDVVILADVSHLDDLDRRRLAHFASDGGGVLILPGAAAQPQFYNGELLARAPALMPARIGPLWEAGAAAPVLDLGPPASGYPDHPALARFRDAADVDLTTARFARYFRLLPLDPSTGARILCRFTDGSPALAERTVGLGRVSLFASLLVPEWNTLPFKPAFVPFLHGLVSYLGQGPNSRRNLRVGDPLVWALPAAAGETAAARAGIALDAWTLAGPDGRRLSLQPLRDRDGRSGVERVSLDALPRAGLYHLFRQPGQSNHGSSKTSPDLSTLNSQLSTNDDDWIAANIKTTASDLRSLSRRQMEHLFRPVSFRWVDPHESLASVVRDSRQGREAWRGLLLAVLALMVCESAMAQIFGRRRGHG